MQPTRLLLAIALAGSACAAPAKDASSTQAAVAPPVKAIPDDPMDRRIAVDQGYSLLAATMQNHDLPMIAGLYAPDASLMLPDSTVRGARAVAARLALLAQSKSMVAFNRTSLGLTVIDDSTIADSGSFVMVSRRSPTDSVMSQGMYHTLWRARPGIGNWVILEDHILPGAGKKKGAR
jgi:ketosteroid isomerase-like protein